MRKGILTFFAILAITTFMTCVDNTPQPIIAADKLNKELLDSEQLQEEAFFLSRYAHALLYEKEMAEIAIERALSDSLKVLAKRIIEESDLELKIIKEIAAQNNITLPDQLGTKAAKKVAKLKTVRLNIFDHEYLEWADNHIDDALVDLNALTEQPNKASSVFQVAKTITLSMHAHKKSINQLHGEVGYHYD